MMNLVGHPMTWLFDRCTDQFEILSHFLAKAEAITLILMRRSEIQFQLKPLKLIPVMDA